VISHKVSYRLAQRPGSYVILKYLRSVTKRVDTQAISCAPAPGGVIDGSRADVSFWPACCVDNVRLLPAFVSTASTAAAQRYRCQPPWLTQLCQKSISLFEPVYDEKNAVRPIRASHVKSMDETRSRPGAEERGKMKTAISARLW